MTKQEKIREGLALLIPTTCGNCHLDGDREIRSDCDDLEEPGSPCLLQLFLAKEYLSYLLSKGGVVKVDRELPDGVWERIGTCLSRKFSFNRISWLRHPKRDECLVELAKETEFELGKAGYVAVEPLIEE